MPSWFRKGPSPHQTALAMVGAKAGDSVVIVGADDPDLAAELARITGLNGQTTVCDDGAGASERVTSAAAKAGALVDFDPAATTSLPFDAGSRDLVVVLTHLASIDDERRQASVTEALRILRPGGRVVIVDGARHSGVLGALQRTRSTLPTDHVLSLLDQAGAKARRQLASVDGVAFYEARKASA